MSVVRYCQRCASPWPRGSFGATRARPCRRGWRMSPPSLCGCAHVGQQFLVGHDLEFKVLARPSHDSPRKRCSTAGSRDPSRPVPLPSSRTGVRPIDSVSGFFPQIVTSRFDLRPRRRPSGHKRGNRADRKCENRADSAREATSSAAIRSEAGAEQRRHVALFPVQIELVVGVGLIDGHEPGERILDERRHGYRGPGQGDHRTIARQQ